MARLVIYSSGAVNQTVELTGRTVRIGRASENDVVLADATQVVSRFHAELRYEDGRFILLDLNSANGTWVWDHRIQRVVLDSGTVAEIGSYRMAIEPATEATTVPPAPAERAAVPAPRRGAPSGPGGHFGRETGSGGACGPDAAGRRRLRAGQGVRRARSDGRRDCAVRAGRPVAVARRPEPEVRRSSGWTCSGPASSSECRAGGSRHRLRITRMTPDIGNIDVSLLETLARLEADRRSVRALAEKAAWHRDKVFEVYSRIVRDYAARVNGIEEQVSTGSPARSRGPAEARCPLRALPRRRRSGPRGAAGKRVPPRNWRIHPRGIPEAPGSGRADHRRTGAGIRDRQGVEAPVSRTAAGRTGRAGPISTSTAGGPRPCGRACGASRGRPAVAAGSAAVDGDRRDRSGAGDPGGSAGSVGRGGHEPLHAAVGRRASIAGAGPRPPRMLKHSRRSRSRRRC